MIPNNKSSRRLQRRSQSRMSRPASDIAHFPTQFDATIKATHTFRMRNIGGSTNQQLTRGNLLNLIRVATSTTQAARIISGIKINWIKLYSFEAVASTIISLEWTSFNGPSVVKSSEGNAFHPAHVSTSPPALSRAALWSITGTDETEVLAIIAGTGAMTTDINVSFILQNGESPSIASSFSGLSIGSVGLDTPANLGDGDSYVNF